MLWFDGRYRLIEKTSPRSGTLLDYLRRFGKENDDVRTVKIGHQTPQLLSVFLVFSLAPVKRSFQLRFLFAPLFDKHSGRIHSLTTM